MRVFSLLAATVRAAMAHTRPLVTHLRALSPPPGRALRPRALGRLTNRAPPRPQAVLAAAQDPKIDVAGWDTYTGPECQSAYQTPSCIKLTVVGDNFGTVQGTLQKGSLLPPAPPPPAQPWDTPAVLFPSDIANRRGGNGVCVARSLYTGDGVSGLCAELPAVAPLLRGCA